LIYRLTSIETSNLSIVNIFKEKLEIFKEYDLVSPKTSLDDIFDGDQTVNQEPAFLNISEMKPFSAHFCPIFIGGFGLGVGFGFNQLPIIKRLAGNIISLGAIGLGVVLCLDLFEGILHFQLTFTLPMLLHVLVGFVGIMLFAVDTVFPPIPGKPPIHIYSNMVALGMAGLAIGLIIPPIEE
jgi:hypothetical protein